MRPRIMLALLPLAEAIDPDSVVVDAKSGVSGAGRGLKPESHAGHVLDNLTPYKVGRHQGAAEIEQALGFPVCFVPHLLPVKRGLVASCYAHPLARDLRERLEAATPAATSSSFFRRASRRSSRACRGPTRPRSPSSRTARPGARS